MSSPPILGVDRLRFFASEAVIDGCDDTSLSERECYVRRFSDSCLKRHQDSSLYTFTTMPKCLESMLTALEHGGEYSGLMVNNDLYAIDKTTGRCECPASTYHGVRSAFGACKHERFRQRVLKMRRARGRHEAEAIVQEAWDTLRHLVYHREKSKPELIRCGPLYTYSSDRRSHWYDSEALLDELTRHNSLPPTGKSTGLPEDEEHEQLLHANAMVLNTDGDVCETCRCTFATNDFGLAFQACKGYGAQVRRALCPGARPTPTCSPPTHSPTPTHTRPCPHTGCSMHQTEGRHTRTVAP